VSLSTDANAILLGVTDLNLPENDAVFKGRINDPCYRGCGSSGAAPAKPPFLKGAGEVRN
jgi:hypothetical protein